MNEGLSISGWLCACVFSLFVACDQGEHQPNAVAYDTNEELSHLDANYVVRGTNVRLRSEPGLRSETLSLLNGGDMLYSSDVTDQSETIGSETAPWHRVQVLSGDHKGKEGWIFGGLVITPESGPGALARRAESNVRTNPGVALALLEEIDSLYPNYDPAGLYSFREMNANAAARARCWSSKQEASEQAASDELIWDALQAGDRLQLRRLASCAYIHMEYPCAGDPLAGPITDVGLDNLVEASKRVDWSRELVEQSGSSCAPFSGGNDALCISFDQFGGQQYIGFACEGAELGSGD